jgi:hypothetical protein
MGAAVRERSSSAARLFFFCLNLPSPLPLFPCYTHSVYTNAVTKASRPLVGDEIDAAGEFLHVSLRRPIDR